MVAPMPSQLLSKIIPPIASGAQHDLVVQLHGESAQQSSYSSKIRGGSTNRQSPGDARYGRQTDYAGRPISAPQNYPLAG